VSATEAAKNFGRIVDAVRESRAEYVVERGGIGVVRIAPVVEHACSGRDLVNLLRSTPAVDPAFGREVEAGRARTNRPVVPASPWES
jgi:hypothetical protein